MRRCWHHEELQLQFSNGTTSVGALLAICLSACAGGLCCASGVLDECGVCDGDSSSCALQATVQLQVWHSPKSRTIPNTSPWAASAGCVRMCKTLSRLVDSSVSCQQVMDASVLFDLGAATVTATFAAFIGGLLGLPPSQIAVTDAVVTPGASTVSTSTSAYIPLQARACLLPLRWRILSILLERRHLPTCRHQVSANSRPRPTYAVPLQVEFVVNPPDNVTMQVGSLRLRVHLLCSAA